MSHYILAQIEVDGPDAYDRFVELSTSTLAAHGGDCSPLTTARRRWRASGVSRAP